MFARQEVLRVEFIDDAVGDALLVDLSVVDVLLHRIVRYQTVDVTAFGLSVTVDATDGLAVVAGVPRRVKHDDTTGTDQVDAKAASSEMWTRYL